MSGKRGKPAVVREFFEMSAAEVMAEWKNLTTEDKDELAIGAAKCLGLTQDDVSFDLT